MAIDTNLLIRLRAKQEEVAQVLDSGYYKAITEMHAKFFQEYCQQGFTREEALEIVLHCIQFNAWSMEPDFKGAKGVYHEEDDDDQ